MPLILGGSSAPAAAFSVDNSCCFNAPDDPNLNKSLGTPTNTKIFTVSAWVKAISDASTDTSLAAAYVDNSDRWNFQFGSGKIQLTGSDIELATTQLFRDPAAWWHIVVAVDTSQGVDTNRVKLYINGTQVTSFSSSTYPTQDMVPPFCDSSGTIYVGEGTNASGVLSKPFDGYIAEFCFIDGTQYAASDFGEFSEDSPTIWMPKRVSGLTFGDNGFYLDFKDSANLGNDANGGTDLTEVNLAATDQMTDSPTNSFCTWSISQYDGVFSEGRRVATQTGYYVPLANFGMMKGKWYWENHLSRSHIMLGMAEVGISQQINPQLGFPFYMIYDNGGATYKYNNAINDLGNAAVTSLGNFADGVIVGIAFDADAEKMWASFNGTWYDGGSGTGDPGAGTNELMGSVRPRFGGTVVPAVAAGTSGSEIIVSTNFGNPPFTISSGNADGNGFGNFEYAPPTGFLALCTKNLSTDGG